MSALIQITYSDSDIASLGQLPPEVRAEVEAWVKALQTVSKPIQVAIARIAREMGVSIQTARRNYDKLRKHGWPALINRAKAPGIDSRSLGLTPEFISYVKGLAEKNQRKTRPAWRKFKADWFAGKEIPGLDNSLPRHELPAGTGYDNVHRKIQDAFALEAMRHGFGRAVAKYGPKIFTTRATLWYGSHLMIDDLWHDGFVVFGSGNATRPGPGAAQIVRVLELDLLDVFSGHLECHGTKPRLRKDDGRMDHLKEKYARLLVAAHFFNQGYSPRGTELLAEHGTAAVSDRVAQILFDRTGGKIRLRESGITGQEQAILGWRGQGKGNPRFKAALESLRNLKHNELADTQRFPGQTGMDVARRPEFLHGQLKECEDTLKAMAVLAQKNPQRARQMRLNLLDYHADFVPLLMDVYRVINNREWHDLEGWHQLGNVAIDYRTTPTADHWLTDGEFSALPVVSQDVLRQAALADPRYLNKRKLSPAAVAARHSAELLKIPAFVVAEILGEDFGFELKVKGAYFDRFQDHELAPTDEPLIYESVIATPDGGRRQLPDGAYWVVLNPFDLSQLFVHDHRRVCLGMASRQQLIDRAHPEQFALPYNPARPASRQVYTPPALASAYGNAARRIAELKAPILKRHAETVRAETARLQHNAAIIASEAIEDEADAESARETLRKSANMF